MCGLAPKKISHVTPNTLLSRAWLLLEHLGADVLPVWEGALKVGLLHRSDLTQTVQAGLHLGPSKVQSCMRALPSNRMRVLVYSSRPTERLFFDRAALDFPLEIEHTALRLQPETAILALGFDLVCAFVNDDLGAITLSALKDRGVQGVLMRCSGLNNVDQAAAEVLGLAVRRVPSYSPHAIAEHATSLILNLLRKTHRAYNRTRENNFDLEGLLGAEIHTKTVGVVGTGRIGRVFSEIMLGFGAQVIANDPVPDPGLLARGVSYLGVNALFERSDIVSLHCPLNTDTHHLVNAKALALMKPGVVLINTGRGALIDTQAVLKDLKAGHIGALGLDVYEEEENVFFEDHSSQGIQDDALSRLMSFPNVLITGHQGFYTDVALRNLVQTTLTNAMELTGSLESTKYRGE